ncbi:hypothetical protein [Actinoplanes regularis]|uniref:Uncharacterized protein n=1 Tax=Actinoplanes regularis TaxID=52697 RepID=A0A238XFC7_9ACTN|nr:hypothetical protein [Actinoplanes regularis]GIE86776.1 hypothetical protein Are01nite_32560 [Actinoplanes regularis]SNR57705.1 hypothetical protein SAMN06264365_103405 [Actinoplanes regularis]
MSPTPVQIMSRRPESATSTVVSQAPSAEPVGIVITTVEQISVGNTRGCGDSNPYGD